MHEEIRLLEVESLSTGYEKKRIIKNVSISVMPGEIVSLIGHNGAGKSTLFKAIFGLLPIWKGNIVFNGSNITASHPRKLLQSGIAYVPQGNRVFPNLTVKENLEIEGSFLSNDSRQLNELRQVFSLFPSLELRLKQKAGTLSGGEKQMLALAKALMLSPLLLLLDEPSLGLSPRLIVETLRRIQEISESIGMAILVIEQKVREVIKISRRVYVLRNGEVSFSGPAQELTDDAKLRDVYL